MRILLYRWGTFNEPVIEKTLRDLGHFVKVVQAQDYKDEQIEGQIWIIAKEASEYHADILFSVDYFQAVAMAAKKLNITYYSWLYHIPQWSLFSYQAQLPNNRIVTFDSAQMQELKQYNVNGMQYMSLAADKELLNNALSEATPEMIEKYRADVSFVGTLYESANNVFNRISAEAREKDVYKSLIQMIRDKRFAYGKEVLYRGVTEEMVEFLLEEIEHGQDHFFFAKQEEIAVQSVLARKITVEERKLMARVLAREFDFKLYTISNTERFPEINNCGPVDFAKQAPLIYNGSKINIYVTPRAIRSGVPLRVLEMMACQGFVLVNYQEDLAKEFEDGKELVMYRSLEEMVEKIRYYLEHESERQQIARAGYEKVLREYNYAEKLRKILDQKPSGVIQNMRNDF
ncbi:MAG: glycosyltransferase [Lachnospiraceae bacterium]|nr:glycosyltransferase [Lachnospiraceae bacterium]